MSKWLDLLTQGKDVEDCSCELEERTAIMQFDGQEPECQHRAVISFIKDNEECFRKYILIINGEHYLRLKGYS